MTHKVYSSEDIATGTVMNFAWVSHADYLVLEIETVKLRKRVDALTQAETRQMPLYGENLLRTNKSPLPWKLGESPLLDRMDKIITLLEEGLSNDR